MMRMMVLLWSAFSLLVVTGFSQPAKGQISGLYTDMHYIEESGDVLGMEVFIVAARGGYYATVQIADGGPDAPVVVKLVVKGNQVEFVMPKYNHYRGTISGKGLTGKFDSEQKATFLARKRSYWQ